jgi:uncharacterized protein (TIGR03435 family)
MRRIVFIAAILATTAALSAAESFELADVHVSPHSDNPSLRVFRRDGRYELLSATMADLIGAAYGIAPERVSGGPSWLESDRFDVIAKIPENATADSLKPMLRNLLADRFGLAVHPDKVLRPAYVLTAGAHPQLTQSDADGGGRCEDQRSAHTETMNGVLECRQVTMSAFAEALRTSRLPAVLGYIADSQVVDQTGLKGAWDFTLKWTGGGLMAKVGRDGVDLFDAVDRQLGLQLKMGQAMLPLIAVDRVNRTPTPNAAGVTQKLPPLRLQFDVADIRPSQQEKPTAPRFLPGGRLEVRGVALIALIQHAWGLDTYDNDLIADGPKWLTTDRYDILAKTAPPEDPSSSLKDDDSLREMLRNMLKDNFKLAVHNDNREVTVFALTAVKPKLKQADPSERTRCKESAAPNPTASMIPQRMIVCTNVSMGEFAERLHGLSPGYANRPVVDLTGLDGSFDFSLVYSRPGLIRTAERLGGESEAPDPNGAVTLYEAVERQLGLKMATTKRMMPALVIDHVEKAPTN